MTTPGTPTFLRTHNDRAAFRLFLEHGALSRSQLGELSGLSKPTASQMISRLERIGLIEPVGETAGARGPNAVSYGVRQASMSGVAISVLADAIEAVVVDPTDAEHPVVEVPTERPGSKRSPESDVAAAIAAACEAANVAESAVRIVAVGVQAAVDSGEDSVSFTDTLPGRPLVGSRERIESRTGVSAILENDVNLAAIAERSVRSTRELSSFVYLWLGEGLGVGIDIDGEVQRGAFGGAGEVGYVEVPRSAASLDPDAMDFTDLLGGPAVRRLVGAAEDARLPDALAGLDTNEAALAALADRVALLASPVLAVLDPSAIVIGGPTGLAAGDGLAALVQERIADEPPPKAKPSQVRTHHRVSVHQSLAGGSPVLHGARRLLVTEIRDRLEAAIVVDAPAIG